MRHRPVERHAAADSVRDGVELRWRQGTAEPRTVLDEQQKGHKIEPVTMSQIRILALFNILLDTNA